MIPINLRSDTQTLPTPQMLEAIAAAPLGDDTYDEDPTVARFEALAAERLGMEAALLVLSGHMGNLVAMMAHAQPGDEVLLDRDSHIYYYEVGSLASVAGLMPWPLRSEAGRIDPDELRSAIRARDLHYPRPALLCLENTHNRAGGRVVPPSLHRELCRVAREAGLRVHLDGARIFNAAIAAGVPVSEYTREVDSVMLCLTKGLSCPLGSVLAGSRDFIARADRVRRRLGGGMRQAGVIAAPGIVALEGMIDRLADDHRHARRLAAGIAALLGLEVDESSVETNMVYVDHRGSGLSTDALLARLHAAGVIASGRPPHQIRLVTNRHHDEATIDEALARIARAMQDPT
ncbi:MAG: aminotransferase class I/II-fold pyridoxal phosphate-dependent enzyme [Myxococcales bacterium]|nr:aminotransferase class I/II-fold pyridoxal phosphate-dependent enzyme [Myxococcales bacterium]